MSRIQKATFIALFLITGFAVTNAYLTFSWLSTSSDPGWVEGHDGEKIIVLRTRNGEQDATLRCGDKILQLNGRPVQKNFSVYLAFERAPVNTTYTLTVLRGGEELNFTLRTRPFSKVFVSATIVAIIIVPLLFLSFAFLLILFSQGNKLALLLACAFAMTIPDVPLFTLSDASTWIAALMILGRPLTYLAFPLYFRFSLMYPVESSLLRRYAWLRKRRYLYAPYVLLGLFGAGIMMSAAYFIPSVVFSLRNSPVGFLVRYGIMLIYLPMTFYAIHESCREAGEEVRRKLNLIWWGLAVGFIPIIVRSFMLLLLGFLPLDVQSRFSLTLLDSFVLIAFSLLGLLPILLMAAITRRQLVILKDLAKRDARFILLRSAFAVAFVFLLLASTYLVLYSTIDFFQAGIQWQVLIVLLVSIIPIVLLKSAEWVEQQHVNIYIKSRSIGLADDLDYGLTTFRTAFMTLRRALSKRLSVKDLNVQCDNVGGEVRDAAYPKEFAATLASRAAEIFSADEVSIFMENTSTGYYSLIASAGYRGEQLILDKEGLILPSKSVIVDRLKRNGTPVHSPYLWLSKCKEFGHGDENTPDHLALETLKRIDANILLPAKHDDQFPLIISVRRSFKFSRREKKALKYLSGIAAVESEFAAWRKVIESNHLDSVLHSLLIAAVRSIRPAQRGSIYLWHDKLEKLVIHAQYGYRPDIVWAIKLSLGEGFAGKAFQLNKIMRIHDFQKDVRGLDVGNYQIREIKSALFVPLQAWGRTIGILCLDNVEWVGAFEAKHESRVGRFGSMVSLAVQNARVQTELRKLGSKLDKGDSGCEAVLEAVYESVSSFTEVKSSHLLLWMDPREATAAQEQKPLLYLTKGESALIQGESIAPRKGGMIAAALESLKEAKLSGSGHPKEIKFGVPGCPPIANKKGVAPWVKASVCFPFQVNEFAAGLLFFSSNSEHSFTESEIEALRLFANEAALGISNAVKREELQYIDRVVWMALLISGLQHDMNQSTDIIDNDLRSLRSVISSLPPERADGALLAASRIHRSVMDIQSHQERMISAWNSDFSVINFLPFVKEIVERGCRAHPAVALDLSDLDDGSVCPVRMIPLQLQLVIKNLVSNAVRASKKSSKPLLTVKKKMYEHRVELTITNTGEQIPEEVKVRIFKEIILDNELHRAGHGMGLWIGRRIVRRHGGDLDLLKSDASGTSFMLWLPLAEEEAESIFGEVISE
jgi:signal transduction histidine kinase/putative methionine-R-sulfoxide reductase with GAF domain